MPRHPGPFPGPLGPFVSPLLFYLSPLAPLGYIFPCLGSLLILVAPEALLFGVNPPIMGSAICDVYGPLSFVLLMCSGRVTGRAGAACPGR